MTDFLLIHGAGHGAWVWDGVWGILDNFLRGGTGLYHSMYSTGAVLAPDLPGHGGRFRRDDPTRVSLDGAVDELLARMETAGIRRPVIAVHDLSGHIALELVRRMKELPRGLVFVGASVPDLFHTAMEMLPFPTRAAIAVMRLRRNTPPASVRLHYALAHPLMCNDMPFSDCTTRVLGRLCPIPLRLFDALPNPETLEPTCPITYAVLNRDRYLLPGAQRQMAASFPQAKVVEMDYGHEAPVTHPQEVADLILAYA
jgi:pimeloyl-ACP methyl ester carboxylesterase